MPATPAPRDKERIEKFWSEYDAYAKLENMITFVSSDLAVFEEYLRSQRGPFPAHLVEQFVQDFQELNVDAEALKKTYNFSKGEEWAKEAAETIDTLSHKSLGKMVLTRDFIHLNGALEKWTREKVCAGWHKSLASLGKIVLDKMTLLEQEIGPKKKTPA